MMEMAAVLLFTVGFLALVLPLLILLVAMRLRQLSDAGR